MGTTIAIGLVVLAFIAIFVGGMFVYKNNKDKINKVKDDLTGK